MASTAAMAAAVTTDTTTAVVTAALATIAAAPVFKVRNPAHHRGARVGLGARAPNRPTSIADVTQKRGHR